MFIRSRRQTQIEAAFIHDLILTKTLGKRVVLAKFILGLLLIIAVTAENDIRVRVPWENAKLHLTRARYLGEPPTP